MSNKVKDIDIKNYRYYFFDDIINIKIFDLNKNKIDEKSYRDILVSYIGYVMIKDQKDVKINNVNPLQLIINKVNGYFEETNTNKYLTLVFVNDSKEKIEKYKELWIKIRDLIRSITENVDGCDEEYIETRFNSDNELYLNKAI